MNIPADVLQILQTLEGAGHAAYVVGGCVRDTLMGKIPHDWDIAASAKPEQVKSLFVRTVDTGIEHGTVMVLLGQHRVEVTTFRLDGEYLDGRRPVHVEFSDNIECDLSRRDFTMNAIAYNPQRGFVDPFFGRTDILAKIIRAVGWAHARFDEDALRMLRAVRFAAQTGFSLHEDVIHAIWHKKARMACVSRERIRAEMGKLILGTHPAICLLAKTGLMPHVLGCEYGGDIALSEQHIAACPSKETMRLALFLCWAGQFAERILRDLRYDKRTIRETVTYILHLHIALPTTHTDIKLLLQKLSQEQFGELLELLVIVRPNERAQVRRMLMLQYRIWKFGECYNLRDLGINGDDIINAGLARGKDVGRVLSAVLARVIHEPGLNSKSKLMRLAGEVAGEIRQDSHKNLLSMSKSSPNSFSS